MADYKPGIKKKSRVVKAWGVEKVAKMFIWGLKMWGNPNVVALSFVTRSSRFAFRG